MVYRMLEAILLGFPPGDGPSQKGKGIDKDSGFSISRSEPMTNLSVIYGKYFPLKETGSEPPVSDWAH